jgi:hypothetical protein
MKTTLVGIVAIKVSQVIDQNTRFIDSEPAGVSLEKMFLQ